MSNPPVQVNYISSKLFDVIRHVQLMTENGWSKVLISEKTEYCDERVNVYRVVVCRGRRSSVAVTPDEFVPVKRDGCNQWVTWTLDLSSAELLIAQFAGRHEIQSGEWN